MTFKRFRAGAAIRVFFIFAFCLAGSVLGLYGLWFTAGLMILSAVVVTVSLLRWAEKGNAGMLKFFEAVHNKDYSISGLGLPQGKTFDELNENLTAILSELRHLDFELKESRYFPMQVLDALPIPVTVLHADTFYLANTAATLHMGIKTGMPLSALLRIHPELYSVIKFMLPGEKRPVEVASSDGPKVFALTKNRFITGGKEYIVVSAQNIRSELDERESEAWQKLVRVMAHEMMNSLTPVISLSETLLLGMQDGEMPERHELQSALEGIGRRSEGLMRFVNAYRRIARLPQPVKTEFDAVGWLEKLTRTSGLYPAPVFVPPAEALMISADRDLLDQAVTNLLKNASEALADTPDPGISVFLYRDRLNRVLIEVADNGPGMDDEIYEKALIPFFTTKAQGSGIGLSLCKQIVRLHGGDMSLEPNAPAGLRVQLWLPLGREI